MKLPLMEEGLYKNVYLDFGLTLSASFQNFKRYSLDDIENIYLCVKGVLEQYSRHVKPAFDYYIAPSMSHADIIVPRGGENQVAINLIVHHVQNQLNQRGFKFR